MNWGVVELVPMSVSYLVAPLLAVLLGGTAAVIRLRRRSAPGIGLDVLLGLCSAAAFASVTHLVLWRFHLERTALSSSDFAEYCQTIARMRTQSPLPWSASRPWPSYVLPGTLASHLGVIDGLVAGALISSVVLGGALYLWGRAIHSRAAGVATVAIAAGLGPVALISRTPSFYPETTAWFVLTSALVAVAVRSRRWLPYTLAVAAVAIALLMDLRGLAWGLSCGALLLVAAAREGRSQGSLRALLLFAGLGLSYRAGEAAYGQDRTSLEDRGSVHRLLIESGRAPPEPQQPPPVDRGFLWGKTPLRQIPDTLVTLVNDARTAPAQGFVAQHFSPVQHDRFASTVGWFSAAGGAVALLGLFWTRWQLLSLLLTAAPFAACTWAAFRMVTWHPRFLLLGLPGVALLLGVAFGTFVYGAAAAAEPGGRPGFLHLLLTALLAWGLPLGWLASPLKVPSTWEVPFVGDGEPEIYWKQATEGAVGAERERECFAALKVDAAAGRVPRLAQPR